MTFVRPRRISLQHLRTWNRSVTGFRVRLIHLVCAVLAFPEGWDGGGSGSECLLVGSRFWGPRPASAQEPRVVLGGGGGSPASASAWHSRVLVKGLIRSRRWQFVNLVCKRYQWMTTFQRFRKPWKLCPTRRVQSWTRSLRTSQQCKHWTCRSSQSFRWLAEFDKQRAAKEY